jgi:diguanylate cyclase (GGDEF)-like protein
LTEELQAAEPTAIAPELQRVLVVDDDDDIVWMISAVLRKDYAVLSASDGPSAVAVLEDNDVAGIIADHMMPGMSGVELLDRSLDLRPHAARILITASERVNVLKDAVNRARVHRFLSKPLRLTELPSILGDAIREAHLEAENQQLAQELARKNEQLLRVNERLEAEVRQRTQELRAAIERLEELALRDGLTGLFNHRYLQETLDAEVSRARRHSHELSLLFIDVDHFKFYNDKHGHPAGDRLLRRIAEVLVGGRESGLPTQTRASDVVARYGGEEFVLVLPQTGLEGALTKAERLRSVIADFPFEGSSQQPLGRISVSVGAVTFPHHGSDKQQLIDAADRELYRAKRSGRDRVCTPGQE